MTVRARHLTAALATAAALAGCAGPSSSDPIADRPYLVSVDPLDADPRGEVAGELIVDRDCVLLDVDGEGTVLPLFAAQARFGPLDGGRVTIDVGEQRLRLGDQVTFRGETGEVTEGLRSRYPGVDLTRCGQRRYALVGDVVG